MRLLEVRRAQELEEALRHFRGKLLEKRRAVVGREVRENAPRVLVREVHDELVLAGALEVGEDFARLMPRERAVEHHAIDGIERLQRVGQVGGRNRGEKHAEIVPAPLVDELLEFEPVERRRRWKGARFARRCLVAHASPSRAGVAVSASSSRSIRSIRTVRILCPTTFSTV